jgi:hypothetical protein
MKRRFNASLVGAVCLGSCVAVAVGEAAAQQGAVNSAQQGVAIVSQPGADLPNRVKTFVYAVDSTLDYVSGEPLFGAVVRGAPYSGEGLTTVTQTLADGTHIERATTAKLYRDSEGRTRREQTLLGLGALNPSGDAPLSITIVDPVAGVSYILEPNSHKARRLAIVRKDGRRLPPPPPLPPAPGIGSVVVVGQPASPAPPPPPPPPPPPTGESLGTSKMEGLDVVGQRMTSRIEVGRIGNDRPIDVVDERWESPALQVLMSSRHHDPRTGDVEYRLTNINRAEPSHDLFVVPPDYTIVDTRDDDNNVFFTKVLPNGTQIKKP